MQSNQVNPVPKPPHQGRFLTKPWIGYGLICFCSGFLLVGLAEFFRGIGLEGLAAIEHLCWLPPLLSFPLFLIGFSNRINVRSLGGKIEIMSHRRHSWVAGFVLLAALLLSVIGLMIPAVRIASQAAQKFEAENAPWVEHGISGVPVAISTPVTYQLASEPTYGFIHLLDVSRQLRVVAIALPREDYAAASIQEAAEAIQQSWIAATPDATFRGKEVVQQDGHQVVRQVFDTREDGLMIHVAMEHHDLTSHWVEMRFVATPSRFREHQQEFADISKSLIVSSQ